MHLVKAHTTTRPSERCGAFALGRKNGSAQESVRGRDFRGFCLSAGIGYSPPDARQRLDTGIGVAGLQGLPA
jgi:hypothetical protein